MKHAPSTAAAGVLLLAIALAGPATAEPAKPAPPPAAKKESKVVKLPSGLEYEELKVGTGPEAQTGQTVQMVYTGRFPDGRQFDSNVGHAPYPVTLGAHAVIKGWEEGIPGMKVGGKRRLTIPPDLAYGKSGYGTIIPPDATLVFDVELVGLK